YNRGDNIVLKRNPDYWQEGKPYVDQLVVRFIPDAATRAAMLEAGDAQLVASSLIPPMEILRLQELPDFEVTARGYEVSSSMHLMDFNTRNPILADVKVRQAFAHLIDTSWITENIWFGFGEPGVSPLHQDQVDFFTTE